MALAVKVNHHKTLGKIEVTISILFKNKINKLKSCSSKTKQAKWKHV